jgi:hypothetical protein
MPINPDYEYWKNRCQAAERFIEESPCGPDVTVSQMEAYQQWNRAKDFGTAAPNRPPRNHSLLAR